MHYFEQTNPEYPRFGAGSKSDNTAEWIVDLTTKVAFYQSDAASCQVLREYTWWQAWSLLP